jgi:hypothetical protein
LITLLFFKFFDVYLHVLYISIHYFAGAQATGFQFVFWLGIAHGRNLEEAALVRHVCPESLEPCCTFSSVRPRVQIKQYNVMATVPIS